MGKLQKAGIVLSVLWVMVVMGGFAITALNDPIELFGLTLLFAGIPLAVVWGIWWILKK